MRRTIDIILTVLGILGIILFFIAWMTHSIPLMLGTMTILPIVYTIGNLQ
jgi:hypothetical protein